MFKLAIIKESSYKCHKRRYMVFLFVALLTLMSCKDKARDDVLTIAVASNFYTPLLDLLRAFPPAYETKIITHSSGALFAQAKNGAPYDVILFADSVRPQALYDLQLSFIPLTYASGALVLYPADNEADLTDLLLKASRISIANPELAPYGTAAKEVIAHLGIALDHKLVMAANVSQAFQYVDTGNATIGLLSQSQLLHAAKVFEESKYLRFMRIEERLYSPIIQQAIVLKRTQNKVLANKFLQFLISDEAQVHVQSLGYHKL